MLLHVFFDAASEVNFSEARSSKSSRFFNPGAAMIPCSESGCFLSKICGSLFSVPQFLKKLRISLHDSQWLRAIWSLNLCLLTLNEDGCSWDGEDVVLTSRLRHIY